jgi:hypothetical protein
MEREEYNLGVQHLNPASRPANKKTYLTTKTTIIQQRAEQSQELKKNREQQHTREPKKEAGGGWHVLLEGHLHAELEKLRLSEPSQHWG